MFGQPSELQRHEALVSVMTAKMKDMTFVREHVLRMMTHFNTAETHRGRIDERSQVTMIMETLPKSFLQFKSNYVMNKLTFTLTQLLNELTHYESMLVDTRKPSGEANVATSSKSSKKKKINTGTAHEEQEKLQGLQAQRKMFPLQ